MRLFRREIGRRCEKQWKLVRAATNEVVALYMSSWSKGEVGKEQEGYLRFGREDGGLGKEFELVVVMSVLAVFRNSRF